MAGTAFSFPALGVGLRPHLTTAKSVEVARCILDGGTAAAAVSALCEADVFFEAGVTAILLRRRHPAAEAGAGG